MHVRKTTISGSAMKMKLVLLAGSLLLLGGCASSLSMDTPVTKPSDSYHKRGEQLVLQPEQPPSVVSFPASVSRAK